MSDSSFSLIAPIDPELGGVLLANMLEAWLDADPSWLTTAEVSDEFEDHRTASEQARLYLCAPVDYGPSTAPSREHGTPVCTAPEGAGIGLDRRCHLHTRRGSGRVGHPNDGAHGLQDLGRRCFDGTGGSGVRFGGFPSSTLEGGLASAVSAVGAVTGCRYRRRSTFPASGTDQGAVDGD